MSFTHTVFRVMTFAVIGLTLAALIPDAKPIFSKVAQWGRRLNQIGFMLDHELDRALKRVPPFLGPAKPIFSKVAQWGRRLNQIGFMLDHELDRALKRVPPFLGPGIAWLVMIGMVVLTIDARAAGEPVSYAWVGTWLAALLVFPRFRCVFGLHWVAKERMYCKRCGKQWTRPK